MNATSLNSAAYTDIAGPDAALVDSSGLDGAQLLEPPVLATVTPGIATGASASEV